MAIPKVCGIETEYGIQVLGGDPNPIAASSVLINAYAQHVARQQTGWDFEDEAPGNDARGFAREGSMPPQVETHLVNTVLTNGARYYVDHAHPEFSTPECFDALECVRYDRAGELDPHPLDGGGGPRCPRRHPVRHLQEQFRRQGQLLRLPRELPHGPGHALHPRGGGDHPALRDPPDLHRGRQGRAARPPPRTDDVDFQISQRAEFFEEQVGLETTLKRPIVNTRDEPHADPIATAGCT